MRQSAPGAGRAAACAEYLARPGTMRRSRTSGSAAPRSRPRRQPPGRMKRSRPHHRTWGSVTGRQPTASRALGPSNDEASGILLAGRNVVVAEKDSAHQATQDLEIVIPVVEQPPEP